MLYRARVGFFHVKKNRDQRVFTMSCRKKKKKARGALDSFSTVCQTYQAEMAIDAYRKVQTGPNNQPGGVQEGLFSKGYQSWTESSVNIEPRASLMKQIVRNAARTHHSFVIKDIRYFSLNLGYL